MSLPSIEPSHITRAKVLSPHPSMNQDTVTMSNNKGRASASFQQELSRSLLEAKERTADVSSSRFSS